MSFAIIQKGAERERIARLLACARSVGARRAAVEAVMAEITKEKAAAFRVDYGDRGFAVLNGDGVPAETKNLVGDDGKAVKPAVPFSGYIHPLLVKGLEAGATYGTKRLDKLVIPSGLCLIIGAGGVGKTPLAHALASHDRDQYGVVRAGEPLAGYSTDPFTIAASLGSAMCASDAVVLDSIKDLLSAGGAAMKSGISRSALTDMTAWSILANCLGTTLYVPLNPSSKDAEVVALMAEAAKSNATSTIVYKSGDNKRSHWEYFVRQGEGLPRTAGELIMTSTGEGAPADVRVGGAPTTSIEGREGTLRVDTVIDRSMFAGAVNRSILSNGN